MLKLDSMTSLYVAELQDMHSAETQLIAALPKMAKAATTPDLAAAFQEHLVQTREHLRRLEEILGDIGESAGSEKCEAMAGLVEEGKEVIDADGEDEIRDAALIVAAQKVEHYEIAGYGSLCVFAKMLGRQQDARLLGRTLDEEKATDHTLTTLAEGTVNAHAARAGTGGMTDRRNDRRSDRGPGGEHENRDPISGEPGAHPVGVGVGAATGGALGAGIGAVGGPIGAAIGAGIGAIAGGLAGKGVAEAVDPTVEEQHWRNSYINRPYVKAGARYEDYGPAYQYGWENAQRYAGRRFDDAERDLANGWTSARRHSMLDWNDARPAVRDSWDRIAGRI